MLDKFLAAVSGTLCKLHCEECHDITGQNDCPCDYYDRNSTNTFITEMIQRIREAEAIGDTPFCREINEEEFINILQEVCNG